MIGRNTKNKQLVVTGAFSNIAGIVSKKGIVLLISIIMIREMSISEYGEFNLFVATVMITGGLALGFDKIIQRFFPVYLSANPQDKASSIAVFIVFTLKRFLFFILLISTIYAVAELGWIDSDRFNMRYIGIAVATGAVLAARVIFILALNAAFMELKLINIAYVLGDSLKLIILYLYWDGGVKQAILVWGAGELLVLLIVVHRFFIRLSPFPPVSDIVNRSKHLEYKRYYHYGKYMMFASIGTYVLASDVDYYFLSYYHDTEVVGLYSFATKIPLILLSIAPSNLMFNIILPLLFNKLDSGSKISEASPHIITLLKLSLIAWTVMASLCAVNIIFIIRYIFDPKYEAVIPYILFWLVMLYPLVIKNVFEPIARAMEYAKVYLFTVLAATLNLVGNILLIPKYGLEGALASTGLSIMVLGFGISYYVAKKIGLKISIPHFCKITLSFIASGGMVYILNTELSLNFVGRVLSNVLLVGGLMALYWPSFWFDQNELKYLHSFRKKDAKSP